ncbi:amidohydrolase family protein [Marinitoga litoralis]|uniref:amidohydrolase family protein n=1 Tax=Marinitoga litoralis TaxID=570855 RepID=UPI00195FF262|nr:amidohydrolase family protein [Marinitoga litoralis]MBM7560344.1 putative amidohydrolase YtcJ [Marinitoga litoralis]
MYYLNENGIFVYKNTKINSNKYVTPLITDTHMHILGFGEKLLNPDLENMEDSKIIELIENKLKNNSKKIILRGWSKTNITKDSLDNLSKDIPIILIRRCGHVAICNSKILEHLNKNTEYIVYETGEIREKALEEFYEIFGYFSDIKKAYNEAKNYLLSKGYGYIHSDDLHGIKKEDLPFDNDLKVYEKVAINNYEELIEYHNNGIFNDFTAVKVYVDGSFGGRTAYLRENYNDGDNRGNLVWKKEELKKVLEFCENNNLHLCMHAIGDGAIDEILETFDDLKPQNIHRIIHASILHNDQIERIKKYRIILDMQPQFIESDKSILKSRLGQRDKLTYRFKNIYEEKIPMFFSSDAPVEMPDWFRDAKTLERLGLPLNYIIYNMTYFPKLIDGFDRNNGQLIFKENPFEKLTIPIIEN